MGTRPLFETDNLTQAEAIARSLLAAIPDDVVATSILGLICYRTGRLPEAMRFFSLADRCASQSVGKPGDAAVPGGPASGECLLEATRPGSNLARGWYDLGLILARHGRYRQAANALAAAVAARPGFVEAQRTMRAISSRLRHAGSGARPPAWRRAFHPLKRGGPEPFCETNQAS